MIYMMRRGILGIPVREQLTLSVVVSLGFNMPLNSRNRRKQAETGLIGESMDRINM